jgi:hypothetical protein
LLFSNFEKYRHGLWTFFMVAAHFSRPSGSRGAVSLLSCSKGQGIEVVRTVPASGVGWVSLQKSNDDLELQPIVWRMMSGRSGIHGGVSGRVSEPGLPEGTESLAGAAPPTFSDDGPGD